MSHVDASALQSDITMVTNWISDCGLKLNSAKTKLTIISRKRSPPKLSVCIDGIPKLNHSSILELLSLQTYLGPPTSTPLALKLESSLAFYIGTSIRQIVIALPICIKPPSYQY